MRSGYSPKYPNSNLSWPELLGIRDYADPAAPCARRTVRETVTLRLNSEGECTEGTVYVVYGETVGPDPAHMCMCAHTVCVCVYDKEDKRKAKVCEV